MIVFVIIFSIYFFFANARQARGKLVLEGTVRTKAASFRLRDIGADDSTGRLSLYVLNAA